MYVFANKIIYMKIICANVKMDFMKKTIIVNNVHSFVTNVLEMEWQSVLNLIGQDNLLVMELLLLVFLLLALIFILIKEKFKPRYKFLPDERTEENNFKAYQ